MLLKKLWRTIGLYRAQFISMMIMIALGIGMFIGFNMEWVSIDRNTGKFFDETGYADYRVMSETGGAFTRGDAEKLAAVNGVDEVSRFVAASVKVPEKNNTVTMTVTENEKVSGMLLVSGDVYDAAATEVIWLSDRYAEVNGVSLGDKLTLSFRGLDFTGTVRGLIKSGEYLVCTVEEEGQLMPDYEKHGYAYISPVWYADIYARSVADATAAAVAGQVGAELYETTYQAVYNEKYQALKEDPEAAYYPQVHLLSALDKSEIVAAADDALGRTNLILSREESTSYAAASGEAQEGKTMGSILPVLFLLIAVLTMVTTMHRLVAKEKTQIGTLKALGFRDRKILGHYTSYGLMIGIIGIVAGVLIGYGVAWMIMNPSGMMGTYMDMPEWKLYMPWFCYPVLAGVLLLLVLISYLSTREMLRGTAADALRPYTPKKVRPLLFERTKLFHRLSFGTRWNLRDTMRHKARTAMSLLGVVGCMILVVGSMGMRDTMNGFLQIYYNDATNYKTRIYLTEDATDEERDAVIERYAGDASATLSVQLGDKPVSLEVYRVTHDKVRFPDRKNQFITPASDGAYVCMRISEEYGVDAGDTLKVSPYGTDKTYTIRIAGVIRSVTEGLVLSEAYADSLGLEYQYGYVYTDTPEAEVVHGGAVSSTQDKQEIIDSFDTFMQIMNLMIVLLIVAAVLLGVVVLYNLGVMSYTERYREMATLKVVGFPDRKIGGLLIGQNMGVTLVGMILGLPLGIAVLQLLVTKLASEYEMRLMLGPLTFIVSILLTAGTSFLVSLLVARKNRKIDMVEALKGAE